MNFLTEARLPFLDSVLAGSSQSIMLEVLFWNSVYLVYAGIGSHLVRTLYRRLPIWKTAGKLPGIFCGNGRDDAVLMTLLGIHHASACALMVAGIQTSNEDLWRHGYLLETGFEMADLLSLLFKLYPYRFDGIKSDIKAAMVFHHLPGLALCFFIMDSGLYANPHMQAIAAWLLGPAAVSCVVAVAISCFDFRTQMWPATALYNFGFGFFTYCRFYVFPKESFALLADVKADDDLNSTLIHKLLYFGLIALTLFNLAIVSEGIPKCFYYIRCAMKGQTPSESVPPSRDSVLRSRRRQSSVMAAVDAVGGATKRRASSVAIVMMLHPAMGPAISGESMTSESSGGDDDDDDMTEEDRKALYKTMSSISSSKKKA